MFNPWKTLAPIDLKPMYELPMRVSLLEPPFLTAALPVVGITIALVAVRRRWPAGLAVWLAYALTLAPVSGLVHAGPQLVADRFCYLPSLGLCLLLGAGVAVAARRATLASVAPIVAAAWIAWLASMTWWQVQIWRDTNTLFIYTLALDPDCGWCHAQYGGALGNRGDLPGAIPARPRRTRPTRCPISSAPSRCRRRRRRRHEPGAGVARRRPRGRCRAAARARADRAPRGGGATAGPGSRVPVLGRAGP